MKPEDRLEAVARKLGDDAAGRFDAELAGERVVARLKREGRRQQFKVTRVLMRVAAVAVLAVGIGVTVQSRFAGNDHGLVTTAVELADLSNDELSEVVDSLLTDEPVYELAVNDLSDLTEDELAQLLELMES